MGNRIVLYQTLAGGPFCPWGGCFPGKYREEVVPSFVGLSEPPVVGYLEEDFPGT